MSGNNPIYPHKSTSGVDSSAAGLPSHLTLPRSATSSRETSTPETPRPAKKRRLNKPDDRPLDARHAPSPSISLMNSRKRAEKTRQLSAEADTKREIRSLALHAKADQGHDLLNGINVKGDRLKIWFDHMGLPCYPARIARVKSSKPPMDATAQPTTRQLRSSTISPPLKDVSDSDSDTDSDSGLTVQDEAENSDPPVDVKYATASTVTPEQMKSCLHWEFIDLKRNSKHRIKNTGAIYTRYYRYEEVRTQAVHDITHPVLHKPNQQADGYLALDRKITQHLKEEQYRMFSQQCSTINRELPNQEHLEKQPKLYISTTWTEELKKEEPKYFAMPASHAEWIPKPTYKGFRRRACSVTTDLQSLGSVHSDGGLAPLDGVTTQPIMAPPLPPPEIVQYVHSAILGTPKPQETLEANKLLLEYRFDEGDSRDVKEDKASRLSEALRVLNHPWERRRAIGAMTRRMAEIPGVLEVIKLLPPSQIEQNDKAYGNGNTTLNCNSQDLLLFEPFIIEKFLAFPGCWGKMTSEGPVEKIVGNLLKGIVAGSDLIDRDNSPLPFPKHLKVVGTNPSPDIYVRAAPNESWDPSLYPVLFAGECKPHLHYNTWMPRAQLACAFHATLVIFILYYLDTRHSPDSALPPWLFLYGIEYTEFGVIIHAHHPAYRIDKLTGKGHWMFKATSIVDEYATAFEQGGSYILQIQLLAALFRVRSHSIRVLERLKQWERGPAILEILASESNKKLKRVRIWNGLKSIRRRTAGTRAT